MTERRADARRQSQHGCDARHHLKLNLAPRRRAALDLGADRRRHRKDAGVTAGNDSDMCPLGGVAQGRGGAVSLLAIVRWVPRLAGAGRHAVEIGPVTIKCIGSREGGVRLWGNLLRRARPDADDAEKAAHGACSHPGTRTIAK